MKLQVLAASYNLMVLLPITFVKTQVILHLSCMPFTVWAFVFKKINKLCDSFWHRLICILCIIFQVNKSHIVTNIKLLSLHSMGSIISVLPLKLDNEWLKLSDA